MESRTLIAAASGELGLNLSRMMSMSDERRAVLHPPEPSGEDEGIQTIN